MSRAPGLGGQSLGGDQEAKGIFAPAACALLGKERVVDTTDLSGGYTGQVSIVEVRRRGGGQRGCRGQTWHLSFDGEKQRRTQRSEHVQAPGRASGDTLFWGHGRSSPAAENPDSE